MTVRTERSARLAGERSIVAADRALDADDPVAARRGYLAAAGHFRRAAARAAAVGDDGARRADEAAADAAELAARPLTG
ncbi:hypothetical protein [Nakamurella sp.]|uniref:hypothetical protein n=1 Tax=Nakamurella sp. TaxID=1869182 RepID=UPI003B3AE459